jgi:outer membrane protein OmpA-like peptidoglycan-associated protein
MGQTPIQNATVNDLVERLAPAEEQSKTRSLRNIQPKPKSIDLVIQFDLDSAKLKEPSKPLLDNLAAAMKSDRLMSIKFKIEGHTDAQGSQEHNLKLSQSRAESVIAYMSDQGIDKERLLGEGKGFSELLLPDKPKAAENRRVRITTQP